MGLNALFCNHAGIGQGRVTNNLGTFINDLTGALHIPDEKSISMVYQLLDSEGLYVGASSALNVVAAVELAQKLGKGKHRGQHFRLPILKLNSVCQVPKL